MKLLYTLLYIHALLKVKVFTWLVELLPLNLFHFEICMGNLRLMQIEKLEYRNKSYLSHWSL